MDVSFDGKEKSSITLDSGAMVSVCPWEYGEKQHGTKDPRAWMNMRAANGNALEHYGARDVMVTSSTF